MKISNVELRKLEKGYILKVYEENKLSTNYQELALTEEELRILQRIMDDPRL